jgi:hypothetical protein
VGRRRRVQRILNDARAAAPDPALDDFEDYVRGDNNDSYAYSGYMDELEASLGQIRVLVEHSE